MRPVPEPAQALLRRLFDWMDDPTAAPIAYLNSGETGARYVLSAMLDRALYVRLDAHDRIVERLDADLDAYTQAAEDLHQPRVLILDEIDRIDEASLKAIITWLRADRPELRLTLIGRQVPPCLRRDPALADQIDFFLTASSTNPAGSGRKPRLQVRTLGALLIEHDGVPITEWGGRQPQLLFLFCIDRGIVDRRAIFEAFWPGNSAKNAANVFHVTKLKVKNALGGTSLITYGAGYYRIDSVWEIEYDVSRFIECVQQGELMDAIDQREAERLFREATRIYQGDYLSAFTEPWVVERRHELRSIMADVLLRLARYAAERGSSAEAEALLRRSLRHDPLSGAALATLSDLLVDQGRRGEAVQVLMQAAGQHEIAGRTLAPALQNRLEALRSADDAESLG
jgi:DNA-binding SARP family transcriptional activator